MIHDVVGSRWGNQSEKLDEQQVSPEYQRSWSLARERVVQVVMVKANNSSWVHRSESKIRLFTRQDSSHVSSHNGKVQGLADIPKAHGALRSERLDETVHESKFF